MAEPDVALQRDEAVGQHRKRVYEQLRVAVHFLFKCEQGRVDCATGINMTKAKHTRAHLLMDLLAYLGVRDRHEHAAVDGEGNHRAILGVLLTREPVVPLLLHRTHKLGAVPKEKLLRGLHQVLRRAENMSES